MLPLSSCQRVAVDADRLDAAARGVEEAVEDGASAPRRRARRGAARAASEGGEADRSESFVRHLGFPAATTHVTVRGGPILAEIDAPCRARCCGDSQPPQSALALSRASDGDLSSTARRAVLPDELADPAMPLLWALRDLLGLTGTKFGCGVARLRRLHRPRRRRGGALVRAAARRASRQARRHDRGARHAGAPHPLQQAWVDAPGAAVRLLPERHADGRGRAAREATRTPSDAEIDAAITNICRCGTYPRMRAAIRSAAAPARRCARRARPAAATRRWPVSVG